MFNHNKTLNLASFPPPGMQILPDNNTRKQGNKSGPGLRVERVFTPLQWNSYFDKCEQIQITDTDNFCVYSSGEKGIVCVFLHGGGYSALTWSILCRQLLKKVDCRCLAIDLRGHGSTTTIDDSDLSVERMCADVVRVLDNIYGEEAPPIFLIGHSMGGSIAVHLAAKELIPSLVGMSVIDVVEGSAMEALTSMQSFLRGRPKHFASLEHAIKWSVNTGQTRNLEAARVSMPGQVKLLSEQEISCLTKDHETVAKQHSISEDNTAASDKNVSDVEVKYGWRIDLTKTDHFWKGWFQGLSKLFLNCKVPKLLLLAGVDRLDKDLTVAQMQGKFQMEVLPRCGHAVHEDVPLKVCIIIATFLTRHKLANQIIPTV